MPLPTLLGAPHAVASGIGDSFAQTAFSGSMLLAIPIALIAGLISFASPCVVPLVPGYVGFLGGLAGSQAQATATISDDSVNSSAPRGWRGVWQSGRGRVFLGMLLFILGFTIVFVLTGVLTGAIGVALAKWSATITRILGLVVIVMGLAFTGIIPALQNEKKMHHVPSPGLWGAPILGFVFGLGWTPCLGPTLVAINSLALSEGSVARGVVLAVAYSIGLGLPFLLIAVGLEKSAKALAFLRRHRRAIMRIGGGLLVVLGVVMAAGWWTELSAQLSIWIGFSKTVV